MLEPHPCCGEQSGAGMKLARTGMHIILFPGCVIIWGAFKLVSFSGKTEETNQLSEKRKWVLVEGGKAQAQRSCGVSLGLLELCRSSLWLQAGAPTFKSSVNKCISSTEALFPRPTAFPESIVCVPAGILSPHPCPGELTCTKCFSHQCFSPGLLLREWHKTVAELPSH